MPTKKTPPKRNTITRVNTPKAKKAGSVQAAVRAPRKRRKMESPSMLAAMDLPTEKGTPSTDPQDYVILFYAVPGFGKTTFFNSFPNPMYAMCEPGTTGARNYEFNREGGGITSWPVMLRMVELLEERSDYNTIVIDTVDEGFRLAQEYVCAGQGIEHPSDANDFGKTFERVANTFLSAVKRIRQTGRAVHMTGHAMSREVDTASGNKVYKVGPTLGGKAGIRLKGYCDFILYGEFMRGPGNKNMRVIITEGDEIVEAKNRPIDDVRLPSYIRLPEDESQDYAVFEACFRGEGSEYALNPLTLQPNVKTSKAGIKRLSEDKVKGVKKGG